MPSQSVGRGRNGQKTTTIRCCDVADTDGARVGILEKAACNIGSLNEFELGAEVSKHTICGQMR